MQYRAAPFIYWHRMATLADHESRKLNALYAYREELPHFAKLAERLKDRNDVQVVSFNTDENSGAVEPFLKQNGYTFPVLLAQHFAEDLMPYFAIPRTWIIRDRVLVADSAGFGGDGQKWQDEIIAQVK